MRDHLVAGLRDHIPGYCGVFVEAGANNGMSLSNTLHLERECAWSGLLVEPIPHLAAAARANRPNAIVEEVALVSRKYDRTSIHLTYGNLQSLVRGARPSRESEIAHASAPSLEQRPVDTYDVEARAVTLSSLLDAHDLRVIDFLSLDVEGYEPQVLDGLDLSCHQPRFILVETWSWTARAIASRLATNYDPVAVFDVLTPEEAALSQLAEVKAGSKWDALFRARSA
jgi:FkbM family methyltransferase